MVFLRNFFVMALCLSLALSMALSKSIRRNLECRKSSRECQCFRMDNRKRIIGGERAGDREFPFQVHIKTNYINQIKGFYHPGTCGGTLISDQWVLTAAHCVQHPRYEGYRRVFVISLGENDKSAKARKQNRVVVRDTANVIAHENYIRNGSFNDIAVIRLSRSVNFTDAVSPACLPPDSWKHRKFNSQKTTTLGWGREYTFNNEKSDLLKKLDLYAYTGDLCKYANKEMAGVPSNKICGYAQGQNVCDGDSGGPLILKETNHRYVIGVTSSVFGLTCMDRDRPGLFVNVASYLDWIKRVTGEKFCTG